jgi:iron complex transport system ATP-binding protein
VTLACTGASLRLGSTEVLARISLELRAGEVTALLGRNGAGKTTLLRALAGLIAPQAGSITLDGRAVASISPHGRAARIAFAAQRPAVAADFLVEEVVALGRFALPADPARIAAALAGFGLGDFRGRRFGALSIGEQHRVALARAFAQLSPDGILLADEPFAALDLGEAERVRALLLAHARGGGTVVASVHDPARAIALADRLVLLDGRTSRLDRRVAELASADLEAIGAALGARLVPVEGEGIRSLAVAPPLP